MNAQAKTWLIALVFMGAGANAADVTLILDPPTTYCTGEALDVASIEAAEIFSDVAPIPYDDAIDCANDPIPDPPVPLDVFNVPAGLDPITVNLAAGVTYHFRWRVRVNGVWSPLSNETVHTIALPVPSRPTVIRIGGG